MSDKFNTSELQSIQQRIVCQLASWYSLFCLFWRRLAGVLGLDQLSEALVASLAAASGVDSPSPEGSAAEAKELAALSALISLASSREAGFLGSGWVTIMRTLSSLDLLKVHSSDMPQVNSSM